MMHIWTTINKFSHKIHHGPNLGKIVTFLFIIHCVIANKDYIEMTKKIKGFKVRMNKCIVQCKLFFSN
jgi:hypothetical protein